jgi:hypothetical protein
MTTIKTSQDYLNEFDRLDALSRIQALTEEESIQLERAQNALLTGRAYGLNKELARRGLKRAKLGLWS